MNKRIKNILCLCLLTTIMIGCSQSVVNKAKTKESEVTFQSETFEELLRDKNILYYSSKGETLHITMNDKVPDDITISATLLNHKAMPFNTKELELKFTKDKNILTFTIDPTMLYSLSSISNIKEKSYVGYTLYSKEKEKTWHVLVGLKT